MNPDLEFAQREALWSCLQGAIENYYRNTASLRVTPTLSQPEILNYITRHSLDTPLASPEEALTHVVNGMTQYAVHPPHPRYFGLFNPRAAFPGVMADALTAAFNPQLAAWSHSPFAVEVEDYLVREIGGAFGYDEDQRDGVFTTGGAEANLTAVLIALTKKFPAYAEEGLPGMPKRPMIYTSSESHHSVTKAVRAVGLGEKSLRIIPVDHGFRMLTDWLEAQITEDTVAGHVPFMVVATGGTTAAGAIDPLPEIAEVCRKYDLWLHLDAAYGGAVVFEESTKAWLTGAGRADSITFDAHKWLSMPMSTSLLLTRHRDLLSRTFGISTEYMPKEAAAIPVIDPFTHSIQWSRRFSGLKLYLSLLMIGWEGVAQLVRRQVALGRMLRKLLVGNQWMVKNETELPIICFTDLVFETDTGFVPFVCDAILASGQAWLSTYQLGAVSTLRVCITNYATQEEDLHGLIDLLNDARDKYQA